MSKYPYIPDKKMFAAVMFACKLIRETGYFNKAVEKAADYYGVDEEELKRHIRERQSAGQKGKAKGRKYRWFILSEYELYELTNAQGYCEYGVYSIIRATSHENASCHFAERDDRETKARDYGGVYAPYIGHIVVGEHDGYETKSEAVIALKQLKKADLSQENSHD